MSQEDKVYDILIVGGGPGGTSCGFRAKELGMDAMIIDYDDLMKRIRDYSKSKLILPTFGGSESIKFPEGGELIRKLDFEPIDKDDMCERWKGFYKEHDVPYRVGVELLSVERRDDGVLHVMCWDHNSRNEKNYLAKHMVISIGHGVPRRFDIPGNTDGIPLRLTDPDQYVGRPACVLGGGTSSCEAVIAISNAKIAAKDKSAVYWSYRGDRMPRVSKNLADVFFEAYVGNGNIRYYPNSEPTAVITAGDHQEYLSILIDRAKITGRPNETQYLEFPKKDVLACVGEDVPEALLNSLGIEMVKGGKRGKKRMVINRLMETKQPNIYMIGDLLSQAYFETENFDADPSEFVEVKHRGNIKNTLRDGVRCANIIKQRLDGKTDIVTTIEDYEPSNVA